ncbi:hypothetical protein GDO78_001952 [Eleutherodactylus coqui]|uniref:Secreted protein n=1 Tax=Eleutherodactylus coqui TaxID=57060 RepID=A0A8J6FVA7_ELECQ|nr:hypothetical protein GDO78_001952 [Eleutherodactylus coqui]
MTISMGVLLVLLSACPACTHKNRGSKLEDISNTASPSAEIPMLTPPHTSDTTVEKVLRKGTGAQTSKLSPRYSWLFFLRHSDREGKSKRKGHEDSPRTVVNYDIGLHVRSKHAYLRLTKVRVVSHPVTCSIRGAGTGNPHAKHFRLLMNSAQWTPLTIMGLVHFPLSCLAFYWEMPCFFFPYFVLDLRQNLQPEAPTQM